MRQFFVALFIFLPLSILYSQVTIHVPGDYSTIQAGIDAANNGDVVLVSDGIYYENINFKGKAITVRSHFLDDGDTSHISNTIIDGSQPSHPDSGTVVLFNSGEDTTSVLCGFTITGGTGQFNPSLTVRGGGGIFVYYSGAKICNNIIENNSVTYTNAYGGGIVAAASTTIIKNNIIKSNKVSGDSPFGGGISLYNSGLTFILSNKIIDNEATGTEASGGGIDINITNGETVINSNYIKGNITPLNGYGGGGIDLFNWGAPVKVSNNLIVDNSGNKGGGILIDVPVSGSAKSDNLKVEDLSRTNKESTLSKLLLNIPVLVNNTIIYNSATLGGGIYCWDFSPDVMNSIVWGNTQTSGGQIGGTVAATVTYSDVEGGYPGTGNIDEHPLFIMGSEFYLLPVGSPCVDAGDPDPQYNDIEDPNNPGNAMSPALGSLRNDMGHCGGPASRWMQEWPIPVELTSFTATVQLGMVNLNWTTATETNNLGFEIERKILNNQNLSEWEKIGFTEGHGTTTEQQEYSYLDDVSNIQASSFAYRLKQIDYDGSYEYSDEVLVDISVPVDFALQQNYPNPFNPATIINYSLPIKSQVELVVFNALGESVMQLVNEEKEAGTYNVEFNASALPSGVYFYKLDAGNYQQVKKMILMK